MFTTSSPGPVIVSGGLPGDGVNVPKRFAVPCAESVTAWAGSEFTKSVASTVTSAGTPGRIVTPGSRLFPTSSGVIGRTAGSRSSGCATNTVYVPPPV